MANTNRYLSSLSRISSFGHSPVPSEHERQVPARNPPDASTYFTPPASYQRQQPFHGVSHHGRLLHSIVDEEEDDEDVPLDAFDQRLLAEDLNERQWQASQGLVRMSLPKNPFRPTHRDNVVVRHRGGLRSKYHIVLPPSSSSASLVSSPLAAAILRKQQRNLPKTGSNQEMLQQDGEGQPLHLEPSASNLPVSTAESRLQLGHAPPIVQGIELVLLEELPDRFRSVFPFSTLNAVQSKCFHVSFRTSDNLVVSAPTGSGKTVIMELAICQSMASNKEGDFKVIYQAPTKALCAERCRDWQAKFGPLGLQCEELTGDTDHNQIRKVQSASIIVTTPEKWDSVTRKWKDHARLMQLVKLFLIDEVHILKDARGATLEAVISRMKSVGSNVRFVALSATVPNSEDIATWLGRSSTSTHLPAHREVFGEEFRPVQLQKIVYGYPRKNNDFIFDNILTQKIPEVIARHSKKKPAIIFCSTRKSCVQTARSLAELWNGSSVPNRLWDGPKSSIKMLDPELTAVAAAGVAFHHGGIDVVDRRTIADGYLEGSISIICCTSTLAVGVNLPCYLVVIKGTTGWSDQGAKEYADLEVMQMLGRAGRPQFETSACAVILTSEEKVQRYQRMFSGKELLESCLHQNLLDHINAEIGLGTVYDMASAKAWLAGTFLFVRLQRNPAHYRLKDDVEVVREGDLLDQICSRDISLLQETGLISTKDRFSCTEYGDAMSRYYVNFETMKIFLSLPRKAKMSEIISALAQAAEFRDVRFKAGEKSLYAEMNKDGGIKFPVKVDIAMHAHKVSLLIQTELGGTIFPNREGFMKHKGQYQMDKMMVFSHVNRLIRCIIDCQLHLEDSVAARHALEIARSLAARVWDNSPLQLKQIDSIGDISVRKLAGAGVNSLEVLENTEAHRIESLLHKNPPFGMRILAKVADVPKLRVSVKQMGKERDPGKWVKIKFKAEIGFLNDKTPVLFNRKPVYVCFLAESSDGHLIEFRRFKANKLEAGQDIFLSVQLTKPTSHIACHVMCDEIAGTSRSAELKLEAFPVAWFPKPLQETEQQQCQITPLPTASKAKACEDDFGDGELDDGDLLAAEQVEDEIGVIDIDDIVDQPAWAKIQSCYQKTVETGKAPTGDEMEWKEPSKLPNGRWTCQHTCRERNKSCRHKCCSEGVTKPRKQRERLELSVTDEELPKKKSEGAGVTGGRLKASVGQTRLPFGQLSQPVAKSRSQNLDAPAKTSGEQSTLTQFSLVQPNRAKSRGEWSPDTELTFDNDNMGFDYGDICGLAAEGGALFPLVDDPASKGLSPIRSETIDNSPSRIQHPSGIVHDRSDGSDFYTENEDFVGFAAPPSHVAMKDLRKRKSGSREKSLFITGRSSSASPHNPAGLTNHSRARLDEADIDVFEELGLDELDELEGLAPSRKRTRFGQGPGTPTESQPLEPMSNVKAPRGMSRVNAVLGSEEQETKAEKAQRGAREDQARRWAQLPPELFEMFGSCVELID